MQGDNWTWPSHKTKILAWTRFTRFHNHNGVPKTERSVPRNKFWGNEAIRDVSDRKNQLVIAYFWWNLHMTECYYMLGWPESNLGDNLSIKKKNTILLEISVFFVTVFFNEIYTGQVRWLNVDIYKSNVYQKAILMTFFFI